MIEFQSDGLDNGRLISGKTASALIFLMLLIISLIPLTNVDAEEDSITITNPTEGEKLIAGGK